MDWNDQDRTDEEIILIELRQGLDRMDHVLDQPSVPSKEQLKMQIAERWKGQRMFTILELVLFWLVSLVVIASGMLLVYSTPWSLWVIQGFSFIAAFVLVLRFIIHRRKEGVE
ncbi:YxlC family protein [Paenibacillus crassostreae]|uniref:YxlC family protein n=1 Tax=Paenibacillus crassostreae TaxID=1763538 RepID=A0A167ESZ0_9BACL|nr:YxlC family protein [Paenibacillus crassostreae]AOZ93494.1 hypothetical protein LPB68_15640 [Paenibacillus crassostreae]OAB75851.1 hypothetical protein PNBC_07380 [Paenibacillus crassostreae]